MPSSIKFQKLKRTCLVFKDFPGGAKLKEIQGLQESLATLILSTWYQLHNAKFRSTAE